MLTVILTSSVVSAIIGVLNTYLIYRSTSRRAATFSAIRIATTLEAFVLRCVNRVADHAAFFSSQGAIGTQSMKLPTFPAYPDDITWDALPSTLIERALSLPNDVELDSRQRIAVMEDIDGSEETDHAIKETAMRGLQALELADILRVKCNLPAFQGTGEATRILKEHLEHVTARMRDRYMSEGPRNEL